MARSLLQFLDPNPRQGVHGAVERTHAVLVAGDDVSVLTDRAASTRPLAVAPAAGGAARGL
ncbi:hypothetical protein [Methylobacterium phyllostachyos]|nr:hypothetical protein [Methylobacterium phyllostachyos]